MDGGRYSDLPEVTPAEGALRNNSINRDPTISSPLPESVTPSEAPKYLATGNPFAYEPENPFEFDRAKLVYVGNNDDRRILGLKRRTFFIVAGIVALLVVGAIVGGAVGGTVAKDKKHESSPSPKSSSAPHTPIKNTPKNAAVLATSSLASVNWTDSDDAVQYGVFFQNGEGEMMASFRNVSNKGNITWATINISTNLSSVSLDIIGGSSISAVAYNSGLGSNLRVYAIGTDYQVHEVMPDSGDDPTGAWSQASLGTQQHIKVSKYSNIAAWRPWLDPYAKHLSIYIVWQSDDGNLMFASSADGWSDQKELMLAEQGSGLAFTSIFDRQNYSEVDFKVYYNDNANLREVYIDTDGNFNLKGGGRESTITQATTNSLSLLNFAATYYEYSNILVLDIDKNGGIQGRTCVKNTWGPASTPKLENMPKGFPSKPKFTAIATHQDNRVYGIVDGKIYEWWYEASDPLTWTFESEVDTKGSGS